MTSPTLIHEMRPRIMDRRARLNAAAPSLPAEYVAGLLAEIDAALLKIDEGAYGRCETCGDPIESELIQRNPLERFCLDHLTPAERKAHEQDLALATQIQARLLPPRDVTIQGWETHFRYEPAGIVSGDYCEVAPSAAGDSLFFALGDVAGKGVAASLLMTHLSAIFRSLLSLGLPLNEMMARANRLFSESTPATHYATLVAGRASADGVELCNAGHCVPLLLRREKTERIGATGLPLGLFHEGRYTMRQVPMNPGDSLVLYSDGITEAENAAGDHFEEERLVDSLRAHSGGDGIEMAEGVLHQIKRFCGAKTPQDDMTLMVLRRTAQRG